MIKQKRFCLCILECTAVMCGGQHGPGINYAWADECVLGTKRSCCDGSSESSGVRVGISQMSGKRLGSER